MPAVVLGLLLAAGTAWPAAHAQNELERLDPDPIPGAVDYGQIRVRVTRVGVVPAYARWVDYPRANYLFHAGDGSGRLFLADMQGFVRIFHLGHVWNPPFLDIRAIRGDNFIMFGEGGLKSFAFHPDYAKEGRPGFGLFYTVHTEIAESEPQNGRVRIVQSPVDAVNHQDVVTEWRVSDTDPDRADPASRREIMRIRQPSEAHNTNLVAFNPNARPGDADYGKLYIAFGDGGYDGVVRVEPFRQAQNPANFFGAVIRIDPLPAGDRTYSVPADNPFVGREGFASEIWAYGFRNPQRYSWDRGGRRLMLLGDIGASNAEEVNLIEPGRNYGWSLREGTFVLDRENDTIVYRLPADDARHGFTYPVAQYDHTEGDAISGGFVYRGRRVRQIEGLYLFGDLANGRVFYVDTEDIRQGERVPPRELRLVFGNEERRLSEIVGSERVELRFGLDEQGEIYLVSRRTHQIFRIDP